VTAARLEGLTFHHLGLAVKDDGQALTMLGALGYAAGERVLDPLQNVYVRLCTAPDRPTVEIVQPGPGERSPVDGINPRSNQMNYHTSYAPQDLAPTLAGLHAAGLRVLTLAPRQPAVLFGGRHVSFYRVQGFGILELLEGS
jgi:methylmalonyl-CoA/ethylmalonyl-CoA epimerase